MWDGIGRGMRGLFCGMIRDVSNAREGSRILSFLYRPRKYLKVGCLNPQNSSRIHYSMVTRQ